MELDINPDPQDLNGKGKRNGKKPWQYACIIIAVCIAVAFSLFTDMNNNVSSLICAVIVVPFAYVGFFNKNGIDYFEYQRKKREGRQGNSTFLYVTEKYTKPVFVFEKKRGILRFLNILKRRSGSNG